MPGIICLSDIEIATNTDILQGTRLQTVPRNGWLSFELQSNETEAAANMRCSIQLPSGDTPLTDTLIPTNPAAVVALTAGVLDERQALKLRFRVGQGGHCVFSCLLTGGTSILTWRVTFTPA